jgi:prevent-host-death family protein
MPVIRKSVDLRNSYNEIVDFCNENNEAVFITKNGVGDVVVLPIPLYEELIGLKELNEKLEIGEKDEAAGRMISVDDFIDSLKQRKYV